MGLQFEGVFDNINDCQLAFIRDVLEKRGYKDTKVIFEAVGQVGDNYVANVKRIIVRDENGELRIIAKIAPRNEVMRANMDTEHFFKNEHVMYTKILPKFQQLEEQAEIPQEDRLRFAECYGSFTTAPYEVILLEDLAVPGFSMLDKLKPLPDECTKSVLKNFALLHSLSFVLKHKELETFNDCRNSLFDIWSNMGKKPGIENYFETLEKFSTKIVDGEVRKRHLNRCIIEGYSLCSKYAIEDAGSQYTVIQQGDAWTNNILFKICDDSRVESVLIDYQAAREANPTCDLLYMIWNCTDHKTRLEQYNNWLDYYHSELEKALAYYGLKAKYVYPRDQLDADMKRYARVMFGLSAFLTFSFLLKPEEATKMLKLLGQPINELVEVETDFDEDTNEAIKKRLEDFVDSFVEFGLL